jgi:hypothetical protein
MDKSKAVVVMVLQKTGDNRVKPLFLFDFHYRLGCGPRPLQAAGKLWITLAVDFPLRLVHSLSLLNAHP